MTPEQQIQQRIEKIMADQPAGYILMPGKNQINAIFWQKQDVSEKVLATNFFTATVHNLVGSGRLTPEEALSLVKKFAEAARQQPAKINEVPAQ